MHSKVGMIVKHVSSSEEYGYFWRLIHMSMQTTKNRVTVAQWLKLKPYESMRQSDTYYVRMANELRFALGFEPLGLHLIQTLEAEQVNHLCCMYAAYLEDVVSGTGMWASFVRVNKRLHGHTLPFYEVDKDYYEDEINEADVRFLTWYFIALVKHDSVLQPQSALIRELSESMYAVLDHHWEQAPENPKLQSYYIPEEGTTDFYLVRQCMDHLLFGSYLLFPDASYAFSAELEEVLADDEMHAYMQEWFIETRARYDSSFRTSLHHLHARDWLIEMLGEQHELTPDLNAMGTRVFGHFTEEGEDEHCFHLRHAASGRIFQVLKYSIPNLPRKENEKYFHALGLVRWRGEWWFSGSSHSFPYTEEKAASLKNDPKEISALYQDEELSEQVMESIDIQRQAFRILSKGRDFIFITEQRLDAFTKALAEQTNALIDAKRKGSGGRLKSVAFEPDKHETAQAVANEDEVLSLYFGTKNIDFVRGLASAFPVDYNPYFRPELAKEHFGGLLFTEEGSAEVACHVLELARDKFSFLNEEPYLSTIHNLDFVLRFYKRENYAQRSGVVEVGGA